MESITITLPWPSADLSPNRRGHWAKFENARKNAKSDGWKAALEAGAREFKPKGKVSLFLTFQPPGRYRYDDDGLISRIKYYRDGIADAVGIDDYQFITEKPEFTEPKKPGRVFVKLESLKQ